MKTYSDENGTKISRFWMSPAGEKPRWEAASGRRAASVASIPSGRRSLRSPVAVEDAASHVNAPKSRLS